MARLFRGGEDDDPYDGNAIRLCRDAAAGLCEPRQDCTNGVIKLCIQPRRSSTPPCLRTRATSYFAHRVTHLSLCAALLTAAVGCRPDRQPDPPADQPGTLKTPRVQPEPQPTPLPLFTDITEASDIDFVHNTGRSKTGRSNTGRSKTARNSTSSTSDYYFPAIMAGGVCVFDANNDDRLDIYFINGITREEPSSTTPPSASSSTTPSSTTTSSATSSSAQPTPNRLYLQRSDGTFTDATESSGLGDTHYGMGCAVGDIDNDGDTDIFVTNAGPDRLYRNDGNGTFTDITTSSRIHNTAWSASATFLDYDRDGLLDIYVTNYLRYDPGKTCTDKSGRPDYCGPTAFPGVADVLFHNIDGEHFEDVSILTGIATVQDAGLGIVSADFDDNGFPDLYVANDADPNNLWLNSGKGAFLDEGMMRGLSFNAHGQAEAGMGVTLGDADNDGDIDIFVTHLIDETNTFYQNLGQGDFEDATASVNLGLSGIAYTGFGTALFDYDNDGDLDLAIVNGGVKRRSKPLASTHNISNDGFWNDYAEPNLLLENKGNARFSDATSIAGDFAIPIAVSRSMVPADFDNDGDLDLLVTNLNAPPALYRNNTIRKSASPDENSTTSHANAWIKIRPVDPALRRTVYGATVTVVTNTTTDNFRHIATVTPSAGYLSSTDAPLHFGLGSATSIKLIEIRWLDGTSESFAAPNLRQTLTLSRGTGRGRPR